MKPEINIGDLFLFDNKELYYITEIREETKTETQYTLILMNPSKPKILGKRYITEHLLIKNLARGEERCKHFPI